MCRTSIATSTITVLCAFVITSEIVAACFITNCPPGGKRSTLPPETKSHLQIQQNIRQCARCGPGLVGSCYGPRICCDVRLGCIVGSALEPLDSMLLPCILESMLPMPCKNHKISCGTKGAGQCALPGVCCYQDSCHLDALCIEKTEDVLRENSYVDSTLIDGV